MEINKVIIKMIKLRRLCSQTQLLSKIFWLKTYQRYIQICTKKYSKNINV